MLISKEFPRVNITNNEINISFGSLANLSNEIYYEDNEILINLKTLKLISQYLNLSENELHKINFPLQNLTGQKSNIVINNSRQINDAITLRPHNFDLAFFFIVKRFYPTNFTLKEYQIHGIDWLEKNNFRLLADDMGLGKTAQSIVAATNMFKKNVVKKAFIICPRSLMGNWVNELKIWAKPFKSFEIHSPASTEDLWNGILNYGHFFIINYDQLRNIPDAIIANPPDLIIADEAHKLRKSSSKIHQSIRDLSKLSKNFWALTGTPIEKNAGDLINIMSVINPKFIPKDLEKLGSSTVRSFYRKDVLRRLKKDYLHELEGSNEKTFYLDLLESQRKKYEEVRLKMFKDLDQTNSLKYFSELRAICDSHNGGGVKIEFALDLIEKIVSHDEKVVIFCFKLDPLYDLYNLLVKEYNKNFAYIFEGNLNSENRESILNKFKSDPNTKCLLCSGKIASEGLNLTEANNVIFLNEWWNPSTNNQARDRVLRIGQSKKVNIYNLRTKNTVEESLQFILDNKNQVNNEILEKMIRKEAMSTK